MSARNVKLKCITAMCNKGGIGYKNKLPWGRLKLDMNYFKYMTSPKSSIDKVALLMGTNTFVSLPGPIKKRDLFVLTRDVDKLKSRNEQNQNRRPLFFKAFRSLSQVTTFANANNYSEVWCIGGEQIYKKTLNEWIFDEIHMTYIDKDYKCDTFMQSLPEYYKEIHRKYDYDRDEFNDNDIRLSFHVFKPDYTALENQYYIS